MLVVLGRHAQKVHVCCHKKTRLPYHLMDVIVVIDVETKKPMEVF